MEIHLIDYLEEKCFEVDEIITLQKTMVVKNIDGEKLVKKMNAIYKVFRYANLPDLLINKLIIKNLKLLEKTDHELINIAYVWYQTGLLSEASERTHGLISNDIRRTYLRNIYLSSPLNSRNTKISYDAFRKYDVEFEKDHIGLLNGILFCPNEENLINLYGKGNSFEEKKTYVDSSLNASALKWYLECVKLERKKLSNGKSI